MEESILLSIKHLLGIEPEYTHFDQDIIIQINMALNILHQLGVGQEDSLEVTGENEVWGDLIIDDTNLLMCKTFVYIKVKLSFDPPLNSALTQMYERQLDELTWRINVEVDNGQE